MCYDWNIVLQPNGPYQENKLLMQSYFLRLFQQIRKLSLFCIIIFLGMYEQRTAGPAGSSGSFHSTGAKRWLPFFTSRRRRLELNLKPTSQPVATGPPANRLLILLGRPTVSKLQSMNHDWSEPSRHPCSPLLNISWPSSPCG